jgi:hypothetical protein
MTRSVLRLESAILAGGTFNVSGLASKGSHTHSHTALMMAGLRREGAAPFDV